MSGFAWDRAANTMIAMDGEEILAYAGEDEAPSWRARANGLVTGLAAAGGRLAVVTATGEAQLFDARSGAALRLSSPVEVRLAAVSGRGVVALAGQSSLALCGPDRAPRTVTLAGATALAFSADGKTLAVGTRDAEVAFLDADGGAIRSRARLRGVPAGLAERSNGSWLATVGSEIWTVPEQGAPSRLTGLPGHGLTDISVSEDGGLAGVMAGELVLVLTLPGLDVAAQFKYLDRTVVGVVFGPGTLLGVGLEGGDANKMVLATEGVHRSDPHAGRERRRWMLSVSFDSAVLAAAGVKKSGGSVPARAAIAPGAAPSRPKLPPSALISGVVAAAVAAAVIWGLS